MSAIAENPPLLDSTLELCHHIANDSAFIDLQAKVEAFMNDDQARLQYQRVQDQGEHLHHKQHAGVELSAIEIREFEAAREALLANPVAHNFLTAQQQLEALQKEISQHIRATFQLGRVPTPEDIAEANQGGCCGGGCGGGGSCG
ncbi:MAG: YlbF family regulator [Verrucomicrobia bacterium]|nr:MAG: YlbF family regulator [Verrucomicrobiota bacterium]